MSTDPTPDQSAADGYVQRAQLLAELGRHDEAAGELTYGLALRPDAPDALTMLARVHLAAGRPADALTAADAAVAAAPDALPPLVTRAMALADLGRYPESAATADRLLALGADDAYAQRSAAAILADSRNGQPALNAAWRGVELAPDEPQAHLVLGLVAARLELFDLAERAYREALRLDPLLADAPHDVGVIRLEQRRWSQALEHVAEAVTISPSRMDSGRTIAYGLHRLVLWGAGWSLVAAVLVAFAASANDGLSRVVALLAALTGGVVVWQLAARLPGLTRTVLPALVHSDRAMALAIYAVGAAPVLLLVYAVVGSPWPLVLAIAATAIAEFAVFTRTAIR
ncbi:tetratricopeptide repeat protein [Micromonospora sp. WMMD710]|uniref:tetratricopeptide repeat protein n=1 Tax=Micromonospora sp. WMMD710 TaxID=3016085 RepID=UPI0024174A67|nr:tetratricopeptide repeat protein [Micromonospora sp. WMMD710]MDG4761621.1 tetratricopeptide repeat protein [Micromonospora sp. WMMD710]